MLQRLITIDFRFRRVKNPLSNASLRILTGIVGGALVLGLTYVGGWAFGLFVAVISLLAQYELYRLMEAGGLRPSRAAGLIIGGLLAVRLLVPLAMPFALVGALGLIALNPFGRESSAPLQSLSATLFGVIYPTFLLTFLIDLREAQGLFVDNLGAFYLTLSVLLLIWSTDTFAYYVGKSIGKHPLAPRVSPKKTWEGSIGGAVGAVIIAIVLKLTLLDFLEWIHVIMLALICGIVSQLGDLAESWMKRSVGAKDSGSLLPGHGGFLDRFDALILAAPLVYLYLFYVTQIY